MARAISPAALAYIRTKGPIYPADLFTITFNGGAPVFRWTSTVEPITIGGITWSNLSPNFMRSSISVRNTIEVPELKVAMAATDDAFVGGTNIKQLIHQGGFDGARLKLERLVMPAPGDVSLGPPTVMFDGRIGQVQVTSIGATIQAKGDVVVMNQYAPRNVFQAGCQLTFCDSICTLSEASFTTSFTVGLATITDLLWTVPPPNPAVFVLGKVTMTSGVNVGQRRTIRAAGPSGIIVSYPFFNAAAVGDTFNLLQGCDKNLNNGSGQDCTAYNNTQHFRGFPFVPQPEFGV